MTQWPILTSMSSDVMDEEDVFTVIPTAPEDMSFDISLDKTSSSPLPTLSKYPSVQSSPYLTGIQRYSNGGGMQTSSSKPKADRYNLPPKVPKETKKKDGKLNTISVSLMLCDYLDLWQTVLVFCQTWRHAWCHVFTKLSCSPSASISPTNSNGVYVYH